jgi:hypothetical protein
MWKNGGGRERKKLTENEWQGAIVSVSLLFAGDN